LKIKYLLPLLIILSIIVYVSNQETKLESGPIESDSESTLVKEKVQPEENIPAVTNEVAPQVTETKVKPNLSKNNEKTQQEITRETEREFLAMNIPTSLSSVKEERYQQVYGVYQKTSFYLSEVAAGHIAANKENLVKALKGLTLYFSEVGPQDQGDDSLKIVSSERPDLFEEAIKELPKKDRALIQQVISLQSASE
jgi:hypothetical protein